MTSVVKPRGYANQSLAININLQSKGDMIVRIYETDNLDLMTVGDMLWKADRQANFHPHASWINSSAFSSDQPDKPDGELSSRKYREFLVKYIFIY